ncbi:MAG: MBL fold metallo-hydrolase [Selenomonadaceae bacterium]|nr:MBL fold metallo-hydrolase [Selenomonadaceae bacterium]
MRELVMLGTGSAMVTRCFNTTFYIQMDDGEIFLTDGGGGNGILSRLEFAGADYSKLHHLFLTHGHTDHILGVLWVVRKIASLMNSGKYNGEFNIYTHDVAKDMLLTMSKLTLKKKDFDRVGDGIFIKEIKDGEELNILGMKLTAFDIESTKAKQFGYAIEFKDGLRLTCLGDEPYNKRTEKYAKGVDWLLSEAFCMYKDRDKFKPYEKNHSTVKEASEIAEKLKVKNLILYHTEDKDIEHRKENYTKEAKEYFKYGNVFVPDDLEVFAL